VTVAGNKVLWLLGDTLTRFDGATGVREKISKLPESASETSNENGVILFLSETDTILNYDRVNERVLWETKLQ
jgi:hypothetical protein